ncbi:MAG: hypothetical protein BGO07_00555 [Alphaproteobacteria bacterium 40-19]|nr:MAG: hypothetical protein BGO07_00555 [Alphaproteobacteria bacterium 40-19]
MGLPLIKIEVFFYSCISILQLAFVQIFLGALFLSLGSWIGFPLMPISGTLQLFCISVIGRALPPLRAGVSVLLWLTAGAYGLPVLFWTQAGPFLLSGPYAGYAWGWIVAAFVMSWWNQGHQPGRKTLLQSFLLGYLIVYGLGVTRLCFLMKFSDALRCGGWGLLPFSCLEAFLAQGQNRIVRGVIKFIRADFLKGTYENKRPHVC